MVDSTGHLISEGSDPNGNLRSDSNTLIDDNSYHTLEVDDTELAEYPTHLALVLKRPRVGKNGLVEPDTLEETYAFVDLKYFMPISANKYIMKSHVNLVNKIFQLVHVCGVRKNSIYTTRPLCLNLICFVLGHNHPQKSKHITNVSLCETI